MNASNSGDNGDCLHRQADRSHHRRERDQAAGWYIGDAFARDQRGDKNRQFRRPRQIDVVGLGEERHRQSEYSVLPSRLKL